MKWYSIFVDTGKEDEVKHWLEYSFEKYDLESLVPKRKLIEKKNGVRSRVLKPLLPGYVLIRTEMDFEKYHKIVKLPHVTKILRVSNYYTEIPEEEIDCILCLIDEKGIIDFSKIFVDGENVIVIDGPLLGKEGIIVRINKRQNRAKIKLDFMGKIKFFDVGIEILKKCRTRC
jgi:transcription termination/antitermination protein NusG